VAGRIFARLGLLGQFGIDDSLLSIAWLSSLANCIMACLGIRYGAGRHQSEVKLAWLPTAIKLEWGTLLCYITALGFVKLSIAVFYMRVFNVTQATRIHLYILIVFIAAFTMMLDLESIFSCIPPDRAWNLNPNAPGFCTNSIPWFWVCFACQLISDIWIIGFAAPRVWALKMQRTQRIALLGMLTLGWVTVVASIVRAVRISTILTSADKTWVSYDSSIWAAVEVNVAILCASAPAWKPIFKRFAPNLLYSLSGRTTRSGPSHGERSKWAKGTSKASQTFEMDRSRNKPHRLFSSSEEELASSAAPRPHGSGPMGVRSSDEDMDIDRAELHVSNEEKSAPVSVRQWCLRNGNPV
jgi:hypothetical protein